MFLFPFTKGVCYIRTSRQDSAIIYNSNEDFHVGQAKVRPSFKLTAEETVSGSSQLTVTNKLWHIFSLPGGVPEQRWPGDSGGCWSDFARGSGSSWVFKERYNLLPPGLRKISFWNYPPDGWNLYLHVGGKKPLNVIFKNFSLQCVLL